MNKKNRVFISYNYKDIDKVRLIVDKLVANGMEVYYDCNMFDKSSSDINKNLKYQIETNETLLLLISANFLAYESFNNEFTSFLTESHKRKINVIPIVIEKSLIPNKLLNYETFNLSNNFDYGLDKIIKKLKVIPEISFDNFTPEQFEYLVADLLKEYDFTNIETHFRTKKHEIDIKAEYVTKNPFGIVQTEHWIIEVKFYKQERFSINGIKQLIEYKRHLLPADLKLLLVTNSILTSVVQDFLNNYQKIDNIQIEVIDGFQLKNLISKRKRLLDKYFSYESSK